VALNTIVAGLTQAFYSASPAPEDIPPKEGGWFNHFTATRFSEDLLAKTPAKYTTTEKIFLSALTVGTVLLTLISAGSAAAATSTNRPIPKCLPLSPNGEMLERSSRLYLGAPDT